MTLRGSTGHSWRFTELETLEGDSVFDLCNMLQNERGRLFLSLSFSLSQNPILFPAGAALEPSRGTIDFTKIFEPREASTLALRSGGRSRHSAARPAGEKSRCTNQSAVTVVSSRRRSIPLSRARCST